MGQSAIPFARPRPASIAAGAPGLALFLSLFLAPAGPLNAQQGPVNDVPGARLTLDIASGALVSDNYDRIVDPQGTSAVWRSNVVLGFASETRTQSLDARIGADVDLGYFADDPSGDDGGLTNQFVTLGYALQNRSSVLTFEGSIRATDNGFDNVRDIDGTDLIIDQGTRVVRNYTASLTLGRNAPLSFSSSLRYNDRRYFDTTDPDLTDQTFWQTRNALSFALNRTTRLVLDTTYSERDEDDFFSTFETNTSAGIGLTFEARGGLTGNLRLATALNETTLENPFTGDTFTFSQESPVLTFALAQPRPNGTLRMAFAQDLNDEGLRTRLTFGRALALPRGALDLTAGITRAEQDNQLRGIGSLRWTRVMPRGRFALDLSQEVTTSDDEDRVRTRAGIDYTHAITALAGLNLRMDVVNDEAVQASADDRQRARLELAYRRQVTRDWNFNAGVRHLTSRETGRDPIIENAIFANISRRFDLRP